MNKMHTKNQHEVMDHQFLEFNTENNNNSKELQIHENDKTLLLNTTNKDKLVFFKPNDVNKMYCVLRPEDLQLKLPSPVKVSKPGRPKRVYNEKKFIELSEHSFEEVPRKVFRTRSGRVTKPPRYMNQKGTDQIEHQLESSINMKQNIDTTETVKEIFDNNLTEPKSQNIMNSLEQKRIISSQYRCGTCKKAYLGRAKMLKHLQLNPEHIAPKFLMKEKTNEDLWTDLINKTKTVSQKEQVQYIYNEFITFIQKARNVIPKLLKPDPDSKSDCITVDQTFSNALGIPQGCYSFIKENVADIILNLETENCVDDLETIKTIKTNNISANLNNSNANLSMTIDATIKNIRVETNENIIENTRKELVQEITNPEVDNCVQNNDQNSLLNLLDTGQVTFDNSNSEEVMNVDQLIHERLKSLTGGEIDSSQNVHLDLSLDMFPYHTN